MPRYRRIDRHDRSGLRTLPTTTAGIGSSARTRDQADPEAGGDRALRCGVTLAPHREIRRSHRLASGGSSDRSHPRRGSHSPPPPVASITRPGHPAGTVRGDERHDVSDVLRLSHPARRGQRCGVSHRRPPPPGPEGTGSVANSRRHIRVGERGRGGRGGEATTARQPPEHTASGSPALAPGGTSGPSAAESDRSSVHSGLCGLGWCGDVCGDRPICSQNHDKTPAVVDHDGGCFCR
jgi:hypothetical protein